MLIAALMQGLKKLRTESPSVSPLEKSRQKSRQVYSMEYNEASTKNELRAHIDLEECEKQVK